jgi:hypothetical protein
VKAIFAAVTIQAAIPTIAIAQNNLEPVVLQGDVAPGIDNAVFDFFSFPSLSADGGLAVRGNVKGINGNVVTAAENSGIWISDASDLTGLQLLVRENDPAPGTDARFGDAGIQFSNDLTPIRSSFGQVAFRSTLVDGGSGTVNANNDSGIWVGDSNALTLVVREGEAAPGAVGSNFCNFEPPIINGPGHVAFMAGLTDGVGGCNDRAGIWLHKSGEASPLRLVARVGDAAPGVSDGAAYIQLLDPVLNPTGVVAFVADLTANSPEVLREEALFAGDPFDNGHRFGRS